MSPSSFRFSLRSVDNLAGVHPDLIAVARLALAKSSIDFGITEGVRTAGRQRALYEAGLAQTLRNSRHLTGHAIDIAAWVGGSVTWSWEIYETLAGTFKAAASEMGVKIVWGGDWYSFKDGVHFELDKGAYL